MPISWRAASRGRRVSASSVMHVAHARAGSTGRPTTTRNEVSAAPRSRRLNSSILPRLRSHPIHTPSRGVPSARAVEEVEAVAARRCAWRAFSASMPARPRVEDLLVLRQLGVGGVGEVGEQREVEVRVQVARAPAPRDARPAPARPRRCRGAWARSTMVRASSGTPRSELERGRRRGLRDPVHELAARARPRAGWPGSARAAPIHGSERRRRAAARA